MYKKLENNNPDIEKIATTVICVNLTVDRSIRDVQIDEKICYKAQRKKTIQKKKILKQEEDHRKSLRHYVNGSVDKQWAVSSVSGDKWWAGKWIMWGQQ